MQKTLQPILAKEQYAAAVEQQLIAYFREAIFGPLFTLLEDAGVETHARDQAIGRTPELKNGRLENAPRSQGVADALRSGRIHWADGKVTGEFSAPISRELRALGATFDAKSRTFSLPLEKVPMDLRTVVAESAERSASLHKQVAASLRAAEGTIPLAPTGLELRKAIDRISTDLQKQFERTVPASALASVSVTAKVTPEMRAAITTSLTENLDLSIKQFAAAEIPEMRRMVERNALQGARADQLARIIEARYGVSKRKAAFLAEQETSLIVSKYREQTARRLGSRRYKWSTSHDERVRPDHARLNGTVQDWDIPPVTNLSTGARNNPGEDFRCLPGDSRVNFVNGVKKAFRRWYSGDLTTLVTASNKTLRATPNHPVLTRCGWKAISLLDQSDEIAEICLERVHPALAKPETDSDKSIPSIREIFETLRESGFGFSLQGCREQFHGDGTDSQVNIVSSTRLLGIHWQSNLAQRGLQFCLAAAHDFASGFSCLCERLFAFFNWDICACRMGGRGQRLALAKTQPGHAKFIGLGAITERHTGLDQPAPDHDALNSGPLGDREFTFATDVRVDDGFWVKLKSIPGFCFSRVQSVTTDRFEGHVFNLETDDGFYATGNVVVSNCRCVAMPIIDLTTVGAA